MTSKRNYSVLIALLLIASLLLAACVRPMPGVDELGGEETPIEAYPAPTGAESGDSAAEEAPPAEEALPVEEGGEAEVAPPADEAGSTEAYPGEAESAEAYPGPDGEVEAGETAEGQTSADEAVEAYPGGEESAAEGEAAAAETTEPEAEGAAGEVTEDETAETGRTHTVAAGETLSQIGSQYNMNWGLIAEANGITNPNSLYPGQVLVIPDAEAVEAAAAAETSDTADTEAADAAETPTEEAPAEEASVEKTTYIVQFGDTLYSISYRFGVNMMDIARANELTSFDQIYAGQELIIPQQDAGSQTSAEPEAGTGAGEEGAVTHVVKEGETIFTIAFNYHIIWTDLVEANNLTSPYTVEAGQTLVIPSGE